MLGDWGCFGNPKKKKKRKNQIKLRKSSKMAKTIPKRWKVVEGARYSDSMLIPGWPVLILSVLKHQDPVRPTAPRAATDNRQQGNEPIMRLSFCCDALRHRWNQIVQTICDRLFAISSLDRPRTDQLPPLVIPCHPKSLAPLLLIPPVTVAIFYSSRLVPQSWRKVAQKEIHGKPTISYRSVVCVLSSRPAVGY